MRIMKNKNGMAYVLTCAVTVVIMMLLAVLFQYRFLASVVRTQREEAQMKLDSVVMKSAVENYDALKQGIAYGDHIDYEKMVRDAYDALGFSDGDTELPEARFFTLVRPQITAIQNGGFGLVASYELILPFEILGESYGEITVPITLTSKFTEK